MSRTRPWADDEYMLVDGMQVVYTAAYQKVPGLLMVHLPGCITTTVHGLRVDGRSVTMPRRLRTDDRA